MNVLIVEPSKFVASVLGSLYAKRGLIPRIADSGKMGLDILHQASPDLIIMSYELRDMKGTELNARGVIGVMFSGTDSHDVVSEAVC